MYKLLQKNKKITFIVIGIIILGIFAWSINAFSLKKEIDTNKKPHVLTTFTVLADMASNVAGEYADVGSLTKTGAEIHGYEPTPQDVIRLQKANIIFDNGLNLEKWAEKLYANVPDVPHVAISTGVNPISIAEGPYEDKPNPHAWMSPKNALIYVDNIAKALSDIDPKNAENYKRNAEIYKGKIKKVDEDLEKNLASLPSKNRYFVSCEGAFTYLIQDYGLKELYLWPINADAQGTPQQIRKVVDGVKEYKVPAVFCESTVNNKAQHQVAQETGATFGGVFYVDSLSASSGPAPTYLKMLEYNANILVNGLSGKGEDASGN
jgi:manganese transport system substrate-binding protein